MCCAISDQFLSLNFNLEKNEEDDDVSLVRFVFSLIGAVEVMFTIRYVPSCLHLEMF